MQYEYSLLSARLELIRRDSTLLSAGTGILPFAAMRLRTNMDIGLTRLAIVPAVHCDETGTSESLQHRHDYRTQSQR